MNRAEVTELRKQYDIKKCSIQRVCGWYIDPEGEVITSFNDNFLVKSDKEQHKYLSLFKKGLSGTGKQLSTLSLKNESDTKTLLKTVVGSALKEQNQPVLDTLKDELIKHFNNAENVLIVALFNSYDVPNRNEDKLKDGESYEVYSYISLYICPMPLEKASLVYDEKSNSIINKEIRRVVADPEFSFTYPSFEDRSSDFDKITVYLKSDKYVHLIDDFLECREDLTVDEQTSVISDIMACAIDNTESKDKIAIVKQFTKALDDEANASSSKTDTIPISSIEKVAEKFNVSPKEVHEVIKKQKPSVDEKEVSSFVSDTVKSKSSMDISSDGVKLKVKQGDSSRIERRVIDGKEYILIELDGKPLTVNGIKIK